MYVSHVCILYHYIYTHNIGYVEVHIDAACVRLKQPPKKDITNAYYS